MHLSAHNRLPWSDTMVLLLVVWLCTLPLILWATVPRFGVGAAAGVALGALAGLLLLCWILCGSHSRLSRNYDNHETISDGVFH